MRFGVCIPNNQGVEEVGTLVDFAAFAESVGYASVWVSEHLLHASYVAARLRDKPYWEALTVLAAVAATTERVRLGTSVLVLPWHHPARLAKTLATIDRLSGGRLDVGVGVGAAEDEYAALGVPFGKRGAIADETLDAMQALWTQDLPEFAGEHYAFSGLRAEPKPLQAPRPPLLIGGNSAAALERVALRGDGWHPLSLSPQQLAAGRARLADRLAAHGRSAEVPVVVRIVLELRDEPWDRPVETRRTARGTPDEIAVLMHAYAEAGATEILLDVGSSDLDAARATLTRFRDEIAPRN